MNLHLSHALGRILLAVLAMAPLAGAVTAAPQSSGHVPPQTLDYSFTDLGAFDPSGLWGTARAINDNGIIVGYAKRANGYYEPLLWVNGAIVPLELLGGNEGMAYDINDKRLVVGWAQDDQLDRHAIRWYNRVAYSLGFLANGDDAKAFAVNNSGHIVGWAQTSTGGFYHGFFWDGAQMQNIPTLSGGYGEAWGINEQDEVVGFCDYGTFDTHAFKWSGGITRDLGGLPSFDSSYALAINDDGVIAGYSEGPSYQKTTVWEGDDIWELPTSHSSSNYMFAINDRGAMVGRSSGYPFVWTGERVLYLNDLLPPDTDWFIREAFDVNNFGQIVGQAELNGVQHGYLLSPLPHLVVTDTLKPRDVIDVAITGRPGEAYFILLAPEAGSVSVGGLPFDLDLGPDLASLSMQFMGVLPASGVATHSVTTPPDGTLYTQDFFWQALTFGSPLPAKSNRMQTYFRIGGA